LHHSQDIKMEKDDYTLLLKLIEKNGNLESLHKQGFQYSQIAKYIFDALAEGHVEKVSDKSFILTSIGKQILLTYNRELKRSNSERFISPQKEYVLQNTYSKYDIYLPPDLKILD